MRRKCCQPNQKGASSNFCKAVKASFIEEIPSLGRPVPRVGASTIESCGPATICSVAVDPHSVVNLRWAPWSGCSIRASGEDATQMGPSKPGVQICQKTSTGAFIRHGTNCHADAPDWVADCNCSLCRRLAWRIVFFPPSEVRIVGEMKAYIWGNV